MKKRVLVLIVLNLFLGICLFFLDVSPVAAAVPSGFENRLVTDIQQPTAMAFLPDGRMLVTTQPGFLQTYDPATGNKQAVLDIRDRICSNSERGLLSVAVDPKFQTNRYIYLYYTKKIGTTCDASSDDINRVSRFSLDGTAVSGEKVLIDKIPSPGGNHNGGDLHFGKDGYLYISVGDGGKDYRGDSGRGGENDASRDRHVLLGKILRINRDGLIPGSNPYAKTSSGARCGAPSANGRTIPGRVCKETFAMGLRNPFRMAFDPDASTTKFNINDVGQNAWEEINQGKKAADYAWNLCEGRHDNPDRTGSVRCGSAPYTPPIHEYSHNSGCSSVTGGAFVPNAGPWPDKYDSSYLFGDYVCGKIFRLYPKSGGGYAREDFVTGLGQGGPVSMTYGPSGRDLYYTTYGGDNPSGEIRRISYTSGNVAPNTAVKATPPYAESAGDLTIDLDASASRDSDGDPITYAWDFNYDGQNFQADPSATGPKLSHTYDTRGKRTTAVRVTDDSGSSNIATVEVFPGDTPPQPVIESPAAGERFRVGQKITLRGSATDDEDSEAPTLEWQVIRHHNNSHTHPYESGNGGSLTIVGPEPEDLMATNPQRNYLEVRLTVPDSEGLSTTTTRKLQPRTTSVTFASGPTNLRLVVNGRSIVAPRNFLSWEGSRLNVYAPRQSKSGKIYTFRFWSDGRAARHTIITPQDYRKYTATYRRQ
jgi:glucose/arabinose dehydrogenase